MKRRDDAEFILISPHSVKELRQQPFGTKMYDLGREVDMFDLLYSLSMRSLEKPEPKQRGRTKG